MAKVRKDTKTQPSESKGITRRSFIGTGAAVVAGALVVPAALEGLVARSDMPRTLASTAYAAKDDGGYGELFPTPDLRDGIERLALPAGFQYRSFGVAGTPMSDGNLTPLAHDGMAAFPLPNGNIRLIRNHEDRNAPGEGSLGGDLSKKYDSQGGGGTTSLEIDPNTREIVRDFVSLNGTTVNCAGGPTPWGSWLSCEETVVGTTGGWDKPHGYIFEVPVIAAGPVEAAPLKAMGRFVHEAVAIDPDTGLVYETEDNGDQSGFYRFIPDRKGRLAAGGKLQMLAIKGRPNYNTITGQKAGKPLPVTWVDINDPDPANAETNSHAVFEQGYARGAANFGRLEGCWYGNGSIFLISTSGGEAGLGQVWEYRPRGRSGGQLILLFESPGADVLDGPDNITVSPNGGLLICEDGDNDQYLRGLTRQGYVFDFALNLNNSSEWAGATFFSWSRDDDDDERRGRREDDDGEEDTRESKVTLFVNRQGATSGTNPPGTPGITFAIWGPWEDGAL